MILLAVVISVTEMFVTRIAFVTVTAVELAIVVTGKSIIKMNAENYKAVVVAAAADFAE